MPKRQNVNDKHELASIDVQSNKDNYFRFRLQSRRYACAQKRAIQSKVPSLGKAVREPHTNS